MKTDLILLIISSAVWVSGLWARGRLTDVSTYDRYYLTALTVIGGALTVIGLLRLGFHFSRRRTPPLQSIAGEEGQQRRQYYRLAFDHPDGPLFIQKSDDHHLTAAFACPVCDISEIGISLACTGVYVPGQPIQGEIIFASGRTAPVNGVVVREDRDRTSLTLHCTIDPPLLMAEQREQIMARKGESAQPVVLKSTLKPSAGSLPSHLPKGICRTKLM